MKTSKFWITATAAVATAGTIGLALAQQVSPQQPASGAQTSLENPGSGTNNTGNASRNSGSTSTNLGSTGSTSAVSGSSDSASSNTVAKADRN